MAYNGVIDDQIDFIDCTGTKYNVTPLIIAAGKGTTTHLPSLSLSDDSLGSYEKTKSSPRSWCRSE